MEKLKWTYDRKEKKHKCQLFIVGKSDVDGKFYMYRTSDNYVGEFKKFGRAKKVAQLIYNELG